MTFHRCLGTRKSAGWSAPPESQHPCPALQEAHTRGHERQTGSPGLPTGSGAHRRVHLQPGHPVRPSRFRVYKAVSLQTPLYGSPRPGSSSVRKQPSPPRTAHGSSRTQTPLLHKAPNASRMGRAPREAGEGGAPWAPAPEQQDGVGHSKLPAGHVSIGHSVL